MKTPSESITFVDEESIIVDENENVTNENKQEAEEIYQIENIATSLFNDIKEIDARAKYLFTHKNSFDILYMLEDDTPMLISVDINTMQFTSYKINPDTEIIPSTLSYTQLSKNFEKQISPNDVGFIQTNDELSELFNNIKLKIQAFWNTNEERERRIKEMVAEKLFEKFNDKQDLIVSLSASLNTNVREEQDNIIIKISSDENIIYNTKSQTATYNTEEWNDQVRDFVATSMDINDSNVSMKYIEAIETLKANKELFSDKGPISHKKENSIADDVLNDEYNDTVDRRQGKGNKERDSALKRSRFDKSLSQQGITYEEVRDGRARAQKKLNEKNHSSSYDDDNDKSPNPRFKNFRNNGAR